MNSRARGGRRQLPRTKKKGAQRVHRQRENGSGLGNLHDGLVEAARNPGSTRAVGCNLRGSARILQLKVESHVSECSTIVLTKIGDAGDDAPSQKEISHVLVRPFTTKGRATIQRHLPHAC